MFPHKRYAHDCAHLHVSLVTTDMCMYLNALHTLKSSGEKGVSGSYGVPNVPKTLRNAVFVYPPLIYKYDTDLAKYLPDLYKSGSDL